MQEINAWLKNKDFETGKALYLKYGANSFFKTLLSNGPTPFNIKKLGAELKSLAPALPATPQIKAKPVPAEKANTPAASQESKTTPHAKKEEPQADHFPRYLELKELQKTYYRQLERNMTELDLGTNENLLHLTAKNILSLHQKIQEIYKLLDYFDEHGKFPATRKIEVVRTAFEEIQLLRQSTCKAKTRLKSISCRDRKGTESLIEANNKRIIELGGKVKS